MNQELLLYFLSENWIIFAGVVFAIIMTYTSFASSRFPVLSPEQAIKIINDGAMIVDIRDEEDFRKGHIRSAHNIPAKSVVENLEKTISTKTKPKEILFYCFSGTKTPSVMKQLKALSLTTKIYGLRGGITEWKETNYPIDSENKKSTKSTKKQAKKR